MVAFAPPWVGSINTIFVVGGNDDSSSSMYISQLWSFCVDYYVYVQFESKSQVIPLLFCGSRKKEKLDESCLEKSCKTSTTCYNADELTSFFGSQFLFFLFSLKKIRLNFFSGFFSYVEANENAWLTRDAWKKGTLVF